MGQPTIIPTLPPYRCVQHCPTCDRRCLGGPARYAEQHLCAEMHQWGNSRE